MPLTIFQCVFLILGIGGLVFALVELLKARPTEKHETFETFELEGVWTRSDPDDPDCREMLTVRDGVIEIIQVSGDSRRTRWKGVYEPSGRSWLVATSTPTHSESEAEIIPTGDPALMPLYM